MLEYLSVIFISGVNMRIVHFLILAVGILCLIYYGVIVAYAGTGSSFSWFWLIAGIFCVLLFILIRYMTAKKITLPHPFGYLIAGLVLLGICIFLTIEGMIIYHSNKKADPDMNYLIVLGAQIRGTRITNSLYKRLKTAETYLKENTETLVIVSGGQGSGEAISEAQAMKDFLIKNGIAKERILVEDKSTNTLENIIYSKKLIEKDNARVALVTNGFHVFRATGIAKKQGLKNIQALAAPSDPILFINYYVREGLGVIKDFVSGNM